MKRDRKTTNIILLTLAIAMAATAAILAWLPPVATPTASSYPAPDRNLAQKKAPAGDSTTQGTDNIQVTIEDGDMEPEAASKQDYINTPLSSRLPESRPEAMTGTHPFADEAKKVLSGKLTENDSVRRRTILNYCEHFRTAYTTKDIDFLRQTFSDNALIIVGHVVKTDKSNTTAGKSQKVSYAIKSKTRYLEKLEETFRSNKKIDVRFSNFHIMRHPTMDGIYGVTLRQKYESDRYSDDGYLFLLWDFRNPAMPKVHVRTWQPAATVEAEDDIIEISDFNLE